MPQNGSNEALLCAKVEALAAIIHASRSQPFKNGKVPETQGIALVFGERASSTNPRYQLVRDLLKEELARLESRSGPQFRPLTKEQELARDELGLPRR